MVSKMERGKIKNLKKGYGFVRSEKGDDLFFAYSFLKKCRPVELNIDTEVTFIRKKSRKKDKGWEAHNICIVEQSYFSSQGYLFLNPYNFVRYLQPCRAGENDPREVRLLSKCRPPGHDRYLGMNGQLHCVLTAATPLFISDPHCIKLDSNDTQHRTYRFFQYEGKEAIPASSLRGMIRSVFEAATNSCFSILDSETNLSRRFEMKEAPKLIPGRIENGGRKVRLLPGTTRVNVNGRPRGKQYSAWIRLYDPLNRNQVKRNRLDISGLPEKETIEIYALLKPGIKTKFIKGQIPIEFWDVAAINDDRKKLPSPQSSEERIEKGYLLVTNQNVENKHDERFFFRTEDNDPNTDIPELLDIPEKVVDSWNTLILAQQEYHYDDIEKRGKNGLNPALPIIKEESQESHPAYSKHLLCDKNLEDGRLVYVLLSTDNEDFIVKDIFPVSVPRTLHPNRIGELLKPELHKCRSIDQLCPACRVFGWVKSDNRQSGKGQHSHEIVAYRGRLQFSHGIKDKDKGAFTQTLNILGTPKPTTGRFYLLKDNGNVLDGTSESECRYDRNMNILRGRKYYLHHSNFNGQESKRPGGIRDRQNRTVKGIQNPGTQFKFTIDFNNLTDIELGALLWSLELDGGFHRLGYAKPLGFGSMQIEVSSIELLNPQVRYQTPGSKVGWSDYKGEEMKDRLVNIFKTAMCKAYKDKPFAEMTNIRDLKLILSECESKLPIHYPRPSKMQLEDGRNYEWFMGNKRKAKRALPLPGNTGLPIIDKDGEIT